MDQSNIMLSKNGFQMNFSLIHKLEAIKLTIPISSLRDILYKTKQSLLLCSTSEVQLSSITFDQHLMKTIHISNKSTSFKHVCLYRLFYVFFHPHAK
jgi:seryl-tRNA synthetase